MAKAVRTRGTAGGLPSGTLTFLMTDIEGSTKAWNVAPRSAAEALAVHDNVITAAVTANGGQVVESGREGDSILAVFAHASDAVRCALEIQRGLGRETWPGGLDVRVRVAVHSGEAQLRSGHYVGPPLYRCARLMATAHGGQVLISNATQELVAEKLPDGASLRDLGVHRLRDMARLEHVYQLEHAALVTDFPPLKSLEPEQTNLPEQLNSFVGRHGDLVALRRLTRESRLVTLVGAGGIGKTRLAIEFARDTFRQWPDGVWWIDLTPVTDPQQVAATVVTTLRIQGIGSAVEQAMSWLATRRALLILDNCEHLVEACAEFCRVALQRCPELRIVAASREPLGISGESRWPVQPLIESEALALFEQRGRLVHPGFQVTASNHDDAVAICARVDELPLGIELAAARLGMMTPRQIASELRERFDVLSAARADDPRHTTMAATIDWSYRLLTASEATLFRRLSVFRGGFTLESATAVAHDDAVPDVLASLTGLVEKSMVAVEHVVDGDARYHLLESQHVFASDRLRDSGEEDAIRSRHYDYFCDALEARTPGIAGPMSEVRAGVAEARWIRPERANVWAAMEWARDHRDDLGIGLASRPAFAASALDVLRVPDLRRWLKDLLARVPPDHIDKLTVISALCVLANYQGDYEDQLILARRGVEMVTPHPTRKWREARAMALMHLGEALEGLLDLTGAEAAYEEALGLLGGQGNPRVTMALRHGMAIIAMERGDFESARATMRACVPVIEANDTPGPFAGALETLATAELGCGDVDAAEEGFRRSIAIFSQMFNKPGQLTVMNGLARVATARGQHLRAVRIAAVVDHFSEIWAFKDPPFWRELLRAATEESRSKLGPAKAAAAWSEGRAMDFDRAVQYALEHHELAADPGPLSRREVEVARLVAQGKSDREIAELLFISPRTAEGHVERIRNKLGLRTRVDVARWALERSL